VQAVTASSSSAAEVSPAASTTSLDREVDEILNAASTKAAANRGAGGTALPMVSASLSLSSVGKSDELLRSARSVLSSARSISVNDRYANSEVDEISL